MPRLLAAALLLGLLSLSACNTMEGFGQDLSNLGNEIEGEAEEHD
ncbi:entericidin A/B family lipoprotein [Rhodovibrio salinarum]|uniref:Entericidin, EcnA/B family n=1 Tax=Rhodovibrio salinarum TaxID=1087 RepID=A0A934QM79_9PROT|nr:entericidin A/B family lipoprotein [Rhodovibrio salinarum]MBK1698949.1 entericidin, EcnA/B family [Rhodovibrio salinarum]